MSFFKGRENKQLAKWKIVLIVAFALVVAQVVSIIAYGKWCEAETKPLLNRIEQIANHEIDVDLDDGEEYHFSLNLPVNKDEVFSKSSIEVCYIFLIGDRGEISIRQINEYRNTISNELIQNPTYVDLYVERIDGQWAVVDMYVFI